VIGGIIGASAGQDEVYDFSQTRREAKLAALQFILAGKH